MKRRDFLALAAAGVASAAAGGCGHAYRFMEIPAEAPLFVNTARTHYRIPVGWEEAQRRLIILARESSGPLEEVFIHSETEGMMYEAGYDEKSDAEGSLSVNYDSDFMKRFRPGDKVTVSHIHPLSECNRAIAKRIMERNRNALNMLAAVDSQARADGREIAPETRELLRKFEYITSCPAIEARDILLPALALPSLPDFGNNYDVRKKADMFGLRFRTAVCSPFGVMELYLESRGWDIFGFGRARAKESYAGFLADASRHQEPELLQHTQAELDRLAEKHGGRFRLVFTDAAQMGFEPYVMPASVP